MEEMSTYAAAQRLGVSQRQVQRLAKSGALSATRVVGNALVIDPLSVNARNRSRVSRGRPWSPEVAWGALWLTSGIEAPWLTYSQRRRLAIRLGQVGASGFAAAVRDRASVVRYRVSKSALPEIARAVKLTGAHSSNTSAAGLAGATNTIDGYCSEQTRADLVARYAMVTDSQGSVTLRMPSVEVVLSPAGSMPIAVVAVDLAGSNDSREHEAGTRMLDELLS